MSALTEVFYISLATLTFGSIAMSIRMGYKSKCSEVECGCIKIKRDVNIEKEEDLLQPPSPKQNDV